MSEFRIGWIGKKSLNILQERKGDISLGELIYEVYFKKYENGEYNPHVFTTFSEKMSVWNAVRRLEKRKLIDFEMSDKYLGHVKKFVSLTKLGEDYVKNPLTFSIYRVILK